MILIAEDNPDLGQFYMAALQDGGWQVELVTSGSAALDRLLSLPALDLVLMDLSLPDMHGVEVAERARAAGCTTPIILVSGAMPLIDKARIADAGFAACLAKPVRLSELFELMRGYQAVPTGAPK